MMGDCYSFNKACLADSGMTPCGSTTPDSSSPNGATFTNPDGSTSTSGGADCPDVSWFWILAGLTGLVLLVHNNQ